MMGWGKESGMNKVGLKESFHRVMEKFRPNPYASSVFCVIYWTHGGNISDRV